ncbi:MAG: alpha/beta hydrolase-fold protein [Opitutaceae bacterium]|jgi:predicted alpha/beta superfamily hydrolase
MSLSPTRKSPAFISRSDELDTDYAIYVRAPEASAGPWPALVFLDGDYAFDVAAKVYQALRESGAVPPAVVVGVGYGHPFNHPGNRRGRDYTPTAAAEEPASGGADRFLAFLTGSLWPELARRYPLDQEPSVLAGHSLSSLLALHVLFQPQPFFRRVLAGAPSIWWDNRSLLSLIKRFRDRQASLAAHLFLGVGTEETTSMLDDLSLLERQLAGRPFAGLKIDSVKFPGRDHYNVTPDLFSAGLRSFFNQANPSNTASMPTPNAELRTPNAELRTPNVEGEYR